MSHIQAKVTICGRADPKAIALTARLILRSNVDEVPKLTRSDLISHCFDIVAHIAASSNVPGFEFYEDAFLYLETLGIKWEGTKFERERQRAFQLDALTDLTEDQADDIKELILKFRKDNMGKRMDEGTKQDEEEETVTVEEIDRILGGKK